MLPDLGSLSIYNRNGLHKNLCGRSVDADAQKRRKFPVPPCHDELVYDKDEIINISDQRKGGGSVGFAKTPLNMIPLEPDKFPSSWEEVQKLFKLVEGEQIDISFEKTATEIYRKHGYDTSIPIKPRSETQAFRRSKGNQHRPQYYLQRLTKPTFVTHIISNGEFWASDYDEHEGEADEYEYGRPSIGQLVYTHGILWSNPSPSWTWKRAAGAVKIVRCRIQLPESTQVVVDRSPVSFTKCELNDKETSLFPDVLLLPGEFEVVSVTSYRSENSEGDSDDEEEGSVRLKPAESARFSPMGMTDEEYAKNMLANVDNFVDVWLKVKRMMELPVPPKVVQSGEAQ